MMSVTFIQFDICQQTWQWLFHLSYGIRKNDKLRKG
jgi:hypothetical protein